MPRPPAARALPALLLAVLVLAACAAGASAAITFERLPGFKSPGTPAQYDKVGVIKVGSSRARNVLVLNPGTSASAAYFVPLAKAIVSQAKGWQVWSVERRENLLKDQSMLNRAKAGLATVRQVFDYYLGWLKDKSITTHLRLIPDSEVAYAKQWGLNTEIQDLRRVVLRAQHLGGKVVVGGHSLGGSITTAYAAWNFAGKPGARGLSGLVFIDGGSSPQPLTAAAARTQLAALNAGSPWLAFGGIPTPLAGLFNSTGSLAVKLAPNAASDGQVSGLLPASIVAPVRATTSGQYGYALDTKTSPPGLRPAQAHLGHLAASGDPRAWDDANELTPLKRYADMFSGWGLRGLDGTAWYHPRRLTLDSGAVAAGNANPAQKVLDVHATQGHHLPKRLRIYAFGAALGGPRVLAAARVLARQSGIPPSRLVLVDRHTTYAHNDPNSASPARNEFLKRLLPFLRRVARG
ncbi:MAG: hypothetical protein E6G56_08725 [Actinobacteria bacterium]|nr:MAG: hypothetical protein E6G56_08725 [Actinomycetota bacterium]